ncbi:FG-GAP-like repeat-containing protein [Myxococcus xanthus]|uniref:Fibronectin type-III domain-containing protein n=1 Tax=Myxococcus xanthus TaxID=34 RepID=A0A7Y4IJC5_MYXXA|nr:FG-GAP-like repeat-containing protein [Myxococcus xanthus]NOJ80209.1 hypothetical protein [Myxococcus xanthus]NOJ86314.1 hypothetical protein [Myxococcus xanthus]
MKTSPRLPSRVLSLLLGALLFSGCISPVSEGERPCPCTDGWTCCPDANVCVADASRCEQLRPPKPPEPTTPSAPREVSAMTDPGTVTLTWFEPAQNGGSAITGYDVGVEPHDDGIQVQVDGTSAVVTGLRAGGTYRFTVTANNAVGVSPAARVDSVNLPDVPTAPVALGVVRGDRQVRLTWNAPASDGGRSVLHYVVTAHPSGASVATDSPVLTTTVSGLTNGAASTFTVHAVNAVGAGPASAESAAVVPAALPGAPVSVAASPGVREVSVSWQPPEDTGGLPVSGYVVTASPGGTTHQVEGAASEATFTSLQDDTEYTFTVSARNDVGQGPGSSTASARTHAPPGAPASVQAEPGVRSLTVAWEPPVSDGRSRLTGYTVVAQPSGRRIAVGADQHGAVLEDVPSTKAQTISVVARNAVGDSPAATAGKPVKSRPTPVEVTRLDTPSAVRGCQPVTYTLRQVDGERADVLVEFDATGSGTFTRATQAADSYYERTSGLVSLSTSTQGTDHTFRWNRPTDLPGAAPEARLRITATVPGTASSTRTHTVALTPPERRCEVNLDTGPVQRVTPEVAGMSHGLALGDFNQDGKLDLAARHDNSPGVTFLRGLGNGAFEAENSPHLSMTAAHLVSADLDRDGSLDLIAAEANYCRCVSFLRGQGNGAFEQPVINSVLDAVSHSSTYDITPPAVLDVDGDGAPEVVVSQRDSLLVLRHTGGGRLAVAFREPFAPRGAVVTGDFDQDGLVDLMVVGPSLHGFYGRGLLTFTKEFLGTLDGPVPHAVTTDFNGDGHLDIVALVVGNRESSIHLLPGDGHGRFTAPVRLHQHTWQSFGIWSHLIAGDLDGNGTQDLAYVHADSDTLTLLQGRGDGTFESRTLTTGMHPSYLVAADFNGSGKTDLAVLSGMHHTVHVIWDLELPTRPDIGWLFATGDFDGDGHTDVASLVDGGVQTHLTRAGGGFEHRGPAPVPPGIWKLLVDRFDSGPTMDLLAMRATSTPRNRALVLLRGNGDGTFAAAEELSLEGVTSGALSNLVAAGDIDGDGDLDLAVTTWREEGGFSTYDVHLLHNQGEGHFVDAGVLTTYSTLSKLALKDLNRDGRADLVVLRSTYPSFELVMFEGRANGSMVKVREYTPVISACAPFGLMFADLNLDEHMDLAVTCAGSAAGGVIPMFGSSNFVFYDREFLRTGGSAAGLTASDLDGDGLPELLVATPEQRAVCILPSRGHTDWGSARCFGTLTAPHDVALLDVDHDGVPEVLTGGGPLLGSGTTLLRLR